MFNILQKYIDNAKVSPRYIKVDLDQNEPRLMYEINEPRNRMSRAEPY